jgi:hypothetical protein
MSSSTLMFAQQELPAATAIEHGGCPRYFYPLDPDCSFPHRLRFHDVSVSNAQLDVTGCPILDLAFMFLELALAPCIDECTCVHYCLSFQHLLIALDYFDVVAE